jgi:hypothetical protein
MRCYACNVILTPLEATRKFEESGEFVDLCTKCLGTIAEDVLLDEENIFDEEQDDDQN